MSTLNKCRIGDGKRIQKWKSLGSDTAKVSRKPFFVLEEPSFPKEPVSPSGEKKPLTTAILIACIKNHAEKSANAKTFVPAAKKLVKEWFAYSPRVNRLNREVSELAFAKANFDKKECGECANCVYRNKVGELNRLKIERDSIMRVKVLALENTINEWKIEQEEAAEARKNARRVVLKERLYSVRLRIQGYYRQNDGDWRRPNGMPRSQKKKGNCRARMYDRGLYEPEEEERFGSFYDVLECQEGVDVIYPDDIRVDAECKHSGYDRPRRVLTFDEEIEEAKRAIKKMPWLRQDDDPIDQLAVDYWSTPRGQRKLPRMGLKVVSVITLKERRPMLKQRIVALRDQKRATLMRDEFKKRWDIKTKKELKKEKVERKAAKHKDLKEEAGIKDRGFKPVIRANKLHFECRGFDTVTANTHHTGGTYAEYQYADLSVKWRMALITSKIKIGNTGGTECKVSKTKLFSRSRFMGENYISDGPYIESEKPLVSGTPIYNSNGKICSFITKSLDNKYILVGPGSRRFYKIEDVEKLKLEEAITEHSTELLNVNTDQISAIVATTDGRTYYKVIKPVIAAPAHVNDENNASMIERYGDILSTGGFTPMPDDGNIEVWNGKDFVAAKIERCQSMIVKSCKIKGASTYVSPVFKCDVSLISGAPIRNSTGQLISIVTCGKGNVKALSGEGSVKFCGDLMQPTTWYTLRNRSSKIATLIKIAIVCFIFGLIGTVTATPTIGVNQQLTELNSACKWCIGDKQYTHIDASQIKDAMSKFACAGLKEEHSIASFNQAVKCANILRAHAATMKIPYTIEDSPLHKTHAHCSRLVVRLNELHKVIGIGAETDLQKSCASKLTALLNLEEKLVEMRKDSPQTSGAAGCEEYGNWKHYGWLSNINGQSCVMGHRSMEVTTCAKQAAGCYSAVGSECTIAHGGIHKKDGVYLSDSVTNATQTCCTLSCFQPEALLEALSNQPLCSTCLSPFSGVIWEADCLGSTNARKPLNVNSLLLFSDVTKITMIGKTYVCKNVASTTHCCGGNGAVSSDTVPEYVDKYCACGERRLTKTVRKTIEQYVKLATKTIGKTQAIVAAGSIMLGLAYPRFMPVSLVVLFGLLVEGVNGDCSVASLVMNSEASITENDGHYHVTTAVVSPGSCINLGHVSLEIVEIAVRESYGFDYSVPFKVKPICQKFQWGCPGGIGESIYEMVPECATSCTKNALITKKDQISSFEGSGCLMSTGISTRLDTCVSVGSNGTEAKFYSARGVGKTVSIVVNVHGHNGSYTLTIDDKSIAKSADFSVDSVNVPSVNIPQTVVLRSGACFETNRQLPSDMCKSFDIFDNTKMDSTCFNLNQVWDATSRRFMTTINAGSFETIQHNYFDQCSDSVRVKNMGETVEVATEVPVAKLMITAKAIGLSKFGKPCDNLENIGVVAESGTSGFHRATVLAISGDMDCNVNLELNECTSTIGNVYRVTKEKKTYKFWCNALTNGSLTIKTPTLTRVVKLTLVGQFTPHYLPTLNQIKMLYHGGFGGISGISSDYMGKAVQFCKYITSFNIKKLVIGGVLLLISYQQLMSANIIACSITFTAAYIIGFTDYVLAVSVGEDLLKLNIDVAYFLILCYRYLYFNWTAFLRRSGFNDLILNSRIVAKITYLILVALSLYFETWLIFLFVVVAVQTKRFLDYFENNDSVDNREVLHTLPLVPFLANTISRGCDEDSEHGEEYELLYGKNINACKKSVCAGAMEIVRCSNEDAVTVDIAKLVEGNNKLTSGYVFKHNGEIYACSHVVKNKMTHEYEDAKTTALFVDMEVDIAFAGNEFEGKQSGDSGFGIIKGRTVIIFTGFRQNIAIVHKFTISEFSKDTIEFDKLVEGENKIGNGVVIRANNVFFGASLFYKADFEVEGLSTNDSKVEIVGTKMATNGEIGDIKRSGDQITVVLAKVNRDIVVRNYKFGSIPVIPTIPGNGQISNGKPGGEKPPTTDNKPEYQKPDNNWEMLPSEQREVFEETTELWRDGYDRVYSIMKHKHGRVALKNGQIWPRHVDDSKPVKQFDNTGFDINGKNDITIYQGKNVSCVYTFEYPSKSPIAIYNVDWFLLPEKTEKQFGLYRVMCIQSEKRLVSGTLVYVWEGGCFNRKSRVCGVICAKFNIDGKTWYAVSNYGQDRVVSDEKMVISYEMKRNNNRLVTVKMGDHETAQLSDKSTVKRINWIYTATRVKKTPSAARTTTKICKFVSAEKFKLDDLRKKETYSSEKFIVIPLNGFFDIPSYIRRPLEACNLYVDSASIEDTPDIRTITEYERKIRVLFYNTCGHKIPCVGTLMCVAECVRSYEIGEIHICLQKLEKQSDAVLWLDRMAEVILKYGVQFKFLCEDEQSARMINEEAAVAPLVFNYRQTRDVDSFLSFTQNHFIFQHFADEWLRRNYDDKTILDSVIDNYYHYSRVGHVKEYARVVQSLKDPKRVVELTRDGKHVRPPMSFDDEFGIDAGDKKMPEYLQSLIHEMANSLPVINGIRPKSVLFETPTQQPIRTSIDVRCIVSNDVQYRVSGTSIVMGSPPEHLGKAIGIVLTVLGRHGIKYITVKLPQKFFNLTPKLTDDAISLDPYSAAWMAVWFISNNEEANVSTTTDWQIYNQADVTTDYSILEIEIPSTWMKSNVELQYNQMNETTRRSLDAWRKITPHVAQRVNGIGLTERTPVELSDLSEIANRSWFALMMSFDSVGSCFGEDTALSTSYHCTYGNTVKITIGEASANFSKLVISDVNGDKVVYEKEMPLATVVRDELVLAFNPMTNFKQLFIVGDTGRNLNNRPGVQFNSYKPVVLDGNKLRYTKFYGSPGDSGCPIINSNGEMVGTYGLARCEQISFMEEGKLAEIDTNITFSPNATSGAQYATYYDECAIEIIDWQASELEKYLLVIGPTGTGKTTRCTFYLAKRMDPGKILLLQPNVASVKNTFDRIEQMIRADKREGDMKITYNVGLRNRDANKTYGRGPREIIVQTYGKWLTSKQVHYNYIMMDEVHVKTDVSLLATDIYLESLQKSKFKLIKMTATPSASMRDFHLCNDKKKLNATMYEIKDDVGLASVRIDQDPGPDHYKITEKDIKCIRGGYTLEKKYVSKGVVIWFVASRNDCLNGVKWAKKVGYGGKAHAVYASGPTDLKTVNGDAWIFATDCIQQSVTIGDATVVVDFLKEYKPEVQITNLNEKIHYQRSLGLRTISEHDHTQRKGRVGRTGPGRVIKPNNLEPMPNTGFEAALMPDLMLQLHISGVGMGALKSYSNQELSKDCLTYQWLLPSEIVSVDAIQHEFAAINTDRKTYSTDFDEKLKLMREFNGDRIYWYLKTRISLEHERRIMQEHELFGLFDKRDDTAVFLKSLKMFVKTFDKEEDTASNFINLYSFTTTPEKPEEDEGLREMRRIASKTTTPTIDESHASKDTSDSDDVTDSSLWFAGAAAVASAAIITGGAWHYISRNTSRRIIAMRTCEPSDVAGVAWGMVTDQGDTEMVRVNQERLKYFTGCFYSLLKQCKNFVKGKLGMETMDCAGFAAYWTKFYTALAGGLTYVSTNYMSYPALVSLFGGTTFGVIFSDLVNILGPSLAGVLCMCLSGFVTFFTGMIPGGVFALSTLVGFVLRQLCSTSRSSFSSLGSTSKPAMAWIALLTGGAGWAIGSQFTALASSQATVVSTVTTGAMATVGFKSHGQIGSSVVVVKALYCLLLDLQAGTLTEDAFGNASSVLMMSMNLNFAGMMMCGALAVTLVAVRAMVKAGILQYAHGVRSSQCPGGEQYEELKNYDQVILGILSVGAICVDPMSIISVVFGYVKLRAQGVTEPGRKAMEQYAGVNPLISAAIFVLNYVRTYIDGNNIGDIQNAAGLTTLAGMLSGLASAATLAWCASDSNFCAKARTFFDYVIRALCKCWGWMLSKVRKTFEWCGRSLARGAMSQVPVLGNFISEDEDQVVQDDIVGRLMVEMSQQSGISGEMEESVVKTWHLGGIPEIEQQMLMAGLGRVSEAGQLNSPFIVDCVRDLCGTATLLQKINFGKSINNFKLTSAQLQARLHSLIGVSSLENDILIIPTERCTLRLQINYTNDTATVCIHIKIKQVKLGSILFVLKAEGENTTGVVVSNALSVKLLRKFTGFLSMVHTGFGRDFSTEDITVKDLQIFTSNIVSFANYAPSMMNLRARCTTFTADIGTLFIDFNNISVDKNIFNSKTLVTPDGVDDRFWNAHIQRHWASTYTGIPHRSQTMDPPETCLPSVHEAVWINADVMPEGDYIKRRFMTGPPKYATGFVVCVDFRKPLGLVRKHLANWAWRTKMTVFISNGDAVQMCVNGAVCKCVCAVKCYPGYYEVAIKDCGTHSDDYHHTLQRVGIAFDTAIEYPYEEEVVTPEQQQGYEAFLKAFLGRELPEAEKKTPSLIGKFSKWLQRDEQQDCLDYQTAITGAFNSGARMCDKASEKIVDIIRAMPDNISDKKAERLLRGYDDDEEELSDDEYHEAEETTDNLAADWLRGITMPGHVDLKKTVIDVGERVNQMVIASRKHEIKTIRDEYGINHGDTPTLPIDDTRSELSYGTAEEDPWIDDQQFEDAIEAIHESVQTPWILGFIEAHVKKTRRWQFTSFQQVKPLDFPIAPRTINSLLVKINNAGSKLSKKEWEIVKSRTRVQLPRRMYEASDRFVMAASRAFYKMQQLYEADPDFFNDCVNIFDPACGYGGFEQYLGLKLSDKQPRTIYVSSLMESGHRAPDIDKMTVAGSNVVISSLIQEDTPGKCNIRDQRFRRYAADVFEQSGVKLDLIMFDIGEFFTDGNRQYKFWMDGEKGKLSSLATAYIDLFRNLREGGKAVIKFTGYFEGGKTVFNRLIGNFRKIKVMKVGTSSLFSTEFYILCSGYSSTRKTATMEDTTPLYQHIGEVMHDQLLKALRILTVRGQGYPTLMRSDWAITGAQGVHYKPILHEEYPSGFSIAVEKHGVTTIENWDMDWDAKFKKFKEFATASSGRKLAFLKSKRMDVKRLHVLGSIRTKKHSPGIKNTFNGLISDMLYNSVGLTADNSTVGHTQVAAEFKQASIQKRLDVDPGALSPEVYKELEDVVQVMNTRYAYSIKNSCRLLTEEEVLSAINNKGSTGLFDQGHNLGEFVKKFPNWYNMAMEMRIRPWAEGKPTGEYMTTRHKAEPKGKKNVEDGQLTQTYPASLEELKSFNNLPHRFIQFSDALTRLAHYILIGDLVNKANHNKIYKGTVNGTPPMVVGRVMRAMWDQNVPREKRIVQDGPNGNLDITVRPERKYDQLGEPGDKPAGIIMDYSGWDGSVTALERLIEANFISSFYPQELKSAIKNMVRELTFAICVNDDGDMWARAGQRGSGELLTSLGNTMLVAANTYRAVSKTLSIPADKLLETVGTMTYRIGENKYKTIEYTRIPQFSDGDDTVIFTTERLARLLQANIEEPLTESNKNIRSATKTGCTVVTDFEKLSFCSHVYEPVIIGPGADGLQLYGRKAIEFLNQSTEYKLWYLPSRPVPDILSKLRLTLKIRTMKWDPTDLDPDGCVMVTRSKLMSYLLLYPHIRPVRYLCLVALAVMGDGTVDLRGLYRKYSDLQKVVKRPTLLGAVQSVYGVTGFDDIGLRDYGVDGIDMKKLRYNTRLTGDLTPVGVKAYMGQAFQWLITQDPQSVDVLAWDSKLAKYFAQWFIRYETVDRRIVSLEIAAPQLTGRIRTFRERYAN